MIFFKYLFYTLKHKWYVMIECFKIGLIWRGLVHDLSKFRPSEFVSYMYSFYGNKKQQKKWEFKFDIAWLKHIHRNKHHWQYWVLLEDSGKITPLIMPLKYMDEMVCDWVGAGKAITGKDNILEWYNRTKNNRRFHPKTKELIEMKIKLRTSGDN